MKALLYAVLVALVATTAAAQYPPPSPPPTPPPSPTPTPTPTPPPTPTPTPPSTPTPATPPSPGTTTVGVERLTFDRPEAWALKYFVSGTMLSGLDVPGDYEPGSVSIGLEGGWLPSLSAEQQRIGFNGRAPQDLNKAPLMLRPRVTVGLPGRLAVTVAAPPPMRWFGVTPRLIAGAIEWSMMEQHDWRVALRGHGQTGTVTGAFTCPMTLVNLSPGSAGNPAGCTAQSHDVATLRYAGVEVVTSRRVRTITPHLAVGVNYIDSVYEVRAQAFGRPDNDRLATSGWTMSLTGGISYPINDKWSVVGDAYYSPLLVRRSSGAPRTLDSFMNARGLIVYRLR